MVEILLVVDFPERDQPLRLGVGKGASTTALTTLKMAVVAPMPMASARTAAVAKAGALNRLRTP